MTGERIIAAVRPAKFAVLTGVLTICAFPISASSTFQPETFRSIQFSPSCRKKVWSVAPDNTLSLILAPSTSYCQATLTFHFAERVSSATDFRLDVSATDETALKVGVEGRSQGEYRTMELETIEVRKGWRRIRIPLIKDGEAFTRITALRISAVTGAESEVFVRRMRFGKAAMISRPAPTPIPPTTVAPKVSETPVVRVAAPEGPIMPVGTPPVEETSFPSDWNLWLVLASILAAAAFMRAMRRPNFANRAQGLSPLYEINTRTWKSHRDADGVITLGGFASITDRELRKIKAQGFNSVWLMGIWEIGAKVRHISRRYGADFMGSPYAIYDYEVSQDLGRQADFEELVRRAHRTGLKIIVDFVPNHMGLDSAWLNTHPEFFIHQVLSESEAHLTEAELLDRYPGYFPHRTPSYPEGGKRVPKTILVAFGKDPYFYPWIDTAQLDYANPALRTYLIDLMKGWARTVDGLRCDMAMLVLREQIKAHRHPEMSAAEFDRMMPEEFWSEAIQTTKNVNPNFVFIAETYWAKEGFLQQLGFDYTYNKPVYEALCGAVHCGNAEGLMNFLRMLGTGFLERSIHFLENHDEERAMNTLGVERQKPAAVLLCTLPGVALLHQGQLEGRSERLPVQRVVPLHTERVNAGLQAFYRRLIRTVNRPLFHKGRLTVLYSNNNSIACYARTLKTDRAVIIVNTSGHQQKGSIFFAPGMQLNPDMEYELSDLYYPLKDKQQKAAPGVRSHYVYSAKKLMQHGLYVELQPYDAHIFVLRPRPAFAFGGKIQAFWHQVWGGRLPRTETARPVGAGMSNAESR